MNFCPLCKNTGLHEVNGEMTECSCPADRIWRQTFGALRSGEALEMLHGKVKEATA